MPSAFKNKTKTIGISGREALVIKPLDIGVELVFDPINELNNHLAIIEILIQSRKDLFVVFSA